MDWVAYLNQLLPGLHVGDGVGALFGSDKPSPPASGSPGPGFSPELKNMILGQPSTAPPPTSPPAPPAGLQTDQETSGKAADAIAKLHDEQVKRRDASNNAAEQISDVLLAAHPVTPDGQTKLNTIQQRIIDAVNNPSMAIDTPAGEKAYLTFLQGQVSDIRGLITSGSLSDQDAAKTLAALTGLIPLNEDSAPPTTDTAAPSTAADPAASAAPDPAQSDPGATDPSLLGPDPAIPAPLDPGLMSGLNGLASAVPQMMSPLGGLGSMAGMPMSMIPPMSGMSAAPASNPPTLPAATDTAATDKPHYAPDTTTQDSGSKPDQGIKQSSNGSDPAPTAQPAADTGLPAAGPPPPTQVTLPDGSTVTTSNASVAKAVNAYLHGTPLDAAFKDAGMTLPPPGTPITTGAVDRTQVGCGTIGMFGDHYVVALSSSKAFSDGQIVPLAQVASGPGFQGWFDPAKSAPPVPAAQLQ